MLLKRIKLTKILVLSLPGYLELAFGFDYRISRHLSEGGSGVIALAEILKQPLYEEFGNICVAKTIKCMFFFWKIVAFTR